MPPNKQSILNYVGIYKDILKEYQIAISEEDSNNIYNLILLIFELDDLYDNRNKSPEKEELERIKQKMLGLMPDNSSIALKTIESFFQSMKDELYLDSSQSLDRYLLVSSRSIGARVITAYLVSKIKIEPSIWFSKVVTEFNNEIDSIIRLANDYLDVRVDEKRISEEVPQIKAMNFFSSKFRFKIEIFCRYIKHKINYYICLLRFKYLKSCPAWQNYLRAIDCSESVIDWAFKTYIIDKNSCQQ